MVLDPHGEPAPAGSPAFKIQQRMQYYMEQIRTAAGCLAGWLPPIEAIAPNFNIDPTPLTRLRHRLPAFPFVPVRGKTTSAPTTLGDVVVEETIPDYSPDDRARIVGEDEPFLSAALVTLEHLVQANWRAEELAARGSSSPR